MPTAARAPRVAQIDESAAGPATMSGGSNLGGFIDESGFAEELARRGNPNRDTIHPFRRHWQKVLADSGVPSRRITRELCSLICGQVAALPIVPSKDEKDDQGRTEFDQQVERLAQWGEAEVNASRQGNAVQVLTGPARQIAKAALELRVQDPDGSKKLAWVNDPGPDDVEE